MKRSLTLLAGALLALGAQAQSFSLANYQLAGNYALDSLGGRGLEASAVTYARDRGSLFFVGDEGLGVVEVSRTGQTLGSMSFSGWPAASTNHDAEGLTYLGNGQLVLVEERLQDAYLFSYVSGGSVNLSNSPWASIGATVGNIGTEGISYDPRGGGSFVSVKQDTPQAVLGGSLSFATGANGGASTMSALFDADAKLGLASLSDVQVLATVDHLAGTPYADQLLILSLDSRLLIQADRAGNVLSRFDLAGLTPQNIEGVTIDEKGVIYLVAEDSGTPNSRLLVLAPTAPVPESGTLTLFLSGVAGLGLWFRRRHACE